MSDLRADYSKDLFVPIITWKALKTRVFLSESEFASVTEFPIADSIFAALKHFLAAVAQILLTSKALRRVELTDVDFADVAAELEVGPLNGDVFLQLDVI